MPSSQLYTGPSYPSLEHRAFDTVATDAGTHPESILYLAPRDHPAEATRERWTTHGPPACLTVSTLDEFVATCYERDQYDGRVTHIDRPLLFRLVEAGVESITTPANPFYTGDQLPRAGLVDAAETLYTELEFAGLLSPAAMQTRLAEVGLEDRARHVAALAAGVETARETVVADTPAETYRTERMHHVATMETALETVRPAIDAVVIGGITHFTPLERDLLAVISATWPTVGILPAQSAPDTPVGVDAGITQALETYQELGFVRDHDAAGAESPPPQRLAANLYRHPATTPPIDDVDATTCALTHRTPTTPTAEIRETARQIRQALATASEPAEIGVVVTSPEQYASEIDEWFPRYEIPYALATDIPLTETALGQLVEGVCTLATEPRSVETLLAVLTNPLVAPTADAVAVDHQDLARVAARAETTQVDTLCEQVDDAVAAGVKHLIDTATHLSTATLETLPTRLETVLRRLGVDETLDGDAIVDAVQRREVKARQRLDRVVETIAMTAPLADCSGSDSVDRLTRALAGVTVRAHTPQQSDRVVVCGLSEAYQHEFSDVYVLGLTATHFPQDQERLAFMQPIYEAHADFTQRDAGAEARTQFGALLASEATLHLSTPQRSHSGEPYVEADVLTELRRFLDFDAITVDTGTAAPGCPEDVQRELGAVAGRGTDTQPDEGAAAIDAAADTGAFTAAQQTRMKRGLACAAARAAPKRTPYDGQLTAETVSEVHPTDTRLPYSPSRLETYATCGFKYYMQEVLDIEAPEPLTREPDAGTRGGFIHETLEYYYRAVQPADGTPVTTTTSVDTHQTQLLTAALTRLETVFESFTDTAFHDQWLTSVLVGLGTPADNPYYGVESADPDAEPPARGLLYRFLEHEFDEVATTTAQPTWFEARIGTPHEAGTPIGDGPATIDTPAGAVPMHGLIDRIDTVPETTPTQAVVRDYKTGATPTETDVLLGVNFQLPVYALLAEDALSATETVGASYYQVSPPTAVNSKRAQLTSDEMVTYYGADTVSTPLVRRVYPYFDTHEAFRTFVDQITPRRIGALATAVREGAFQPTVLDPADAGCRFCEYAHVCDVRPHQRRETIKKIETDDTAGYVPPLAHDVAPEDVVEVE